MSFVREEFTEIRDKSGRLLGYKCNFENCDFEARETDQMALFMNATRHGILHRAVKDRLKSTFITKPLHPSFTK